MLRLKRTSEDFKKFFLLEFTRQLIENSTLKNIYELKEAVKEEEKDKIQRDKLEKKQEKELVKQTIKEKESERIRRKEMFKDFTEKKVFPSFQRPKRPIIIKKVLRVPKTRLPTHLQYLKPTPTQGKEMDLGKLNPILKDPMVSDIECNGPDQFVVVKGVRGIKKTNMVMTGQEINEVIKKFSEASKIPITEGFFKVVVGKLIFSAIISKITGSKFIIKKMMYNPGFR